MAAKFIIAFFVFALPSLAMSSLRSTSAKSMGVDDDDDGDEYEHGDVSTSLDENGNGDSDFSVHQFLAPDDARDGPSNDGANAQAAQMSQSAANDDDTFNSEDTPAADQDSFVQVESMKGAKHSRKKKGVDGDDDDDEFEHGDAATSLDEDESSGDSEFSVHQFLTPDDARDGGSGDSAASVQNKAAEGDDDTFNSEDTPAADQDSFGQQNSRGHIKRKHKHSKKGVDDDDEFEHGDVATSLDEDESADSEFSTHQFLAPDDARDGPSNDGNKVQGSQKSPGEEDTFNSEDTPAADQDSFSQKKSKKFTLRHSKKGVDDDDDEFEHGDVSTSLDEDESADSEFSTHQFLAPDDARDGPSNDGNKVQGSQISSGEEDTFNSEDTPAADQDSLVQK